MAGGWSVDGFVRVMFDFELAGEPPALLLQGLPLGLDSPRRLL